MQNEKVPDWALERAVGLYHHEPVASSDIAVVYKHALARYIAEHEEPPVDPLLGVVEEVLDWWDNHTTQPDPVGHVVKMLRKRGIELARKEDSHAG